MQDVLVMMRQPPRTRIDVEALVEAAVLRRAAELRVRVAAAQRPVAAAGARVVLEHLHLVARVAQLVRGGHAGDAGAEDQHRRAARRAGEIDRTLARRLGGEAERRHRLVHRRAAGGDADHAQQIAPRHRRRSISIRHRFPPPMRSFFNGRSASDPGSAHSDCLLPPRRQWRRLYDFSYSKRRAALTYAAPARSVSFAMDLGAGREAS